MSQKRTPSLPQTLMHSYRTNTMKSPRQTQSEHSYAREGDNDEIIRPSTDRSYFRPTSTHNIPQLSERSDSNISFFTDNFFGRQVPPHPRHESNLIYEQGIDATELLVAQEKKAASNTVDQLFVQSERAYPFDLADTDDQIKMHGLHISRIRLKKLVQLLTSFRSFEVSDITLYTFKHYTTPVELLKLLIQRFALPLPRNLSQSQAKFFMQKNFVVVQAKVLNFIAEWLDKRKQDFQEDSFLYELLVAFLQKISEVPAIFGLHKLIFKQKLYPLLDRIEDQDSGLAEEFSMHNFTPNQYPRLCHISPQFFRKGDFLLLYDSEVIAGQLCLVDSSRLRQIDTDQFLNRSWEKETNAPNIRNFNRYNEAVTRWYELVIILQPSSLARSKMISKLLMVCQQLWKFHNFNSLLNIFTAISLRVEDHLPQSMQIALRNRNVSVIFERLKKLYRSDKQFQNAWQQIQKSSLPCLPSFMLWGKRMESIYCKAQVLKRFEVEGMVNFDTERDICKALKMLKDYQGAYYKFYRVALLYEFFKNEYYRQLSEFCLDLESNQHATKISLDLLKQASLSEHP